MRIPMSLIVDDSCPLVHVYRFHWKGVHGKLPQTKDGRRLVDWIPNAFLDRFCEVVERWGIAGKFSIVPAPARMGDIVRGVAGDAEATRAWLATAKRRLPPRFDFTSEGITHNLTVDLTTGEDLPQNENEWSQTQTRAALTPYLTHQLALLRDAGIDATGVTSPWVFGIRVEPEYIAAIIAAQQAVYGRRFSWYFLHMLYNRPEARPWIAYQEDDTTLVSIPATVRDFWWETIDSPRTDAAFIHEIANRMLTPDGRAGAIREVLAAGGWPVLLTHWQSLFSNGLETGLAVLDELGRRVHATLAEEVEWLPCLELARRTAEVGQRASYAASVL